MTNAFILSQNRAHFNDGRTHVIALSRSDIALLKRVNAKLYLYKEADRRVYGPFALDAKRITKDGSRYRARIGQLTDYRRGAYYRGTGKEKKFALSPIDEETARRLDMKLALANETPSPMLLEARRKGKTLSYRITEMAQRVYIAEREIKLNDDTLAEVDAVCKAAVARPALSNADMERVKNAGTLLFNHLFIDDDAKACIMEKGKIIYLDLDRASAKIHWAAMAHKNRFLQSNSLISFGLLRNMARAARALEGGARFAAVHIPCEDLPNAAGEAEALYAIFETIPSVRASLIRANLSRSDFASVMEDYDLVHIVTHGASGMNGNGIAIGPLTTITGNDVRSFSNPPFIVTISACETASVTAASDDTRFLAPALLRAGVSNVIASAGTLSDSSAEGFFKEFYGSLLAGDQSGVAFRNALIAEGERAFLRYHFFGLHTLRLFDKRQSEGSADS